MNYLKMIYPSIWIYLYNDYNVTQKSEQISVRIQEKIKDINFEPTNFTDIKSKHSK